jgi:hypothetical protein
MLVAFVFARAPTKQALLRLEVRDLLREDTHLLSVWGTVPVFGDNARLYLWQQ